MARRSRHAAIRIIRSIAASYAPRDLAEHYVLTAENRAVHPLMRRKDALSRVSWDEAMRTMAGEFRRVAQQYGPQAVGVIGTGQLVTEEFYTLGKLVQLGLGTSNYDGNTTLCMSTAVCWLQAILWQRWATWRLRGPDQGGRGSADWCQHCGESSDSLPASRCQPREDPHRCRSACDQDGDDGGYLSAGQSHAQTLRWSTASRTS